MQHLFKFNPVGKQNLAQRKRFLDSRDRTQRRLLNEALRQCLWNIDRVSYRYAFPHRDELQLVSRVATTSSLFGLLKHAQKEGDDPLDIQTRFEAIHLFDDAQALAEIEEKDPLRSVSQDIDAMLQLFEHKLFSTKSSKIDVFTYHDPTDSYRVRGFSIGEEQQCANRYLKHNRLLCRQLKDGTPVACDDRAKDTWGTWYKMQGQVKKRNKPNPFEVHDRRGIQLVVPIAEDAFDLLELVVAIIKETGGTIVEVSNNVSGHNSLDHLNQHSSPFFKAIKLDVIWRGRHFEIQIMTFADYYSSKFALNDENHDLYRLKQALEIYLPMVFPHQVYGVAWHDEDVRAHLRWIKTEQLGWKMPREKKWKK